MRFDEIRGILYFRESKTAKKLIFTEDNEFVLGTGKVVQQKNVNVTFLLKCQLKNEIGLYIKVTGFDVIVKNMLSQNANEFFGDHHAEDLNEIGGSVKAILNSYYWRIRVKSQLSTWTDNGGNDQVTLNFIIDKVNKGSLRDPYDEDYDI